MIMCPYFVASALCLSLTLGSLFTAMVSTVLKDGLKKSAESQVTCQIQK